MRGHIVSSCVDTPFSIEKAKNSFNQACQRGWYVLLITPLTFHALCYLVFINTYLIRSIWVACSESCVSFVSLTGTGFYYVTRKNPTNVTRKIVLRKYDPVVRRHVLF